MKPIIKKRMMTLSTKEYKALKKNKEKYQLFFEENPVFNAVIGDDFKIKEINKSFLRGLGYVKEDVVGKLFFSFVEQSQRKPLKQIIQREFKEHLGVEALVKIMDKKGKLHDVHFIESKKTAIYHAMDGTKAMLASGVDVTKQHEVEKKLLEEKAFSEKILFMSNAIIIGLDKNHRVALFNKGAQQTTGYTEKEVMGKDWFKTFFHKKQYKEMNKVWASFWKTNIVGNYTNYICHKNGTDILVTWQNSRIIGNNEERDIIVCVGEDITEVKKAEKKLEENEERFRTIIEHAHTLFYMHDTNHKIQYISPQSQEFFGLKPEECMIKWTKLATNNPINKIGISITKEAIKTGKKQKPYLLELKRKDGTPFLVEVEESPIKNEKGKVVMITGALRDITKEKEAELTLKENEKALQESKEMLQRIIDLMPSRIFWKDKNLNYLGCNTSFAHDAGKKTPSELIGKNDFAMSWKKQAASYRVDDKKVIVNVKSKIDFEELRPTPDGTIWLKKSKIPLTDTEGNVNGLLGTYIDITERKRAEEALVESEQRNRTLIEGTQAAFYRVEANGVTSYVTRYIKKLIKGYEISDWLKKDAWITKVHSEDEKKTYSEWNKGVKSKKPFILEYRLVAKNGSSVWVEDHAFPKYKNNKLDHVDGFILDITQKKNVDIALRDSEEKLRNYIEKAPMMILVMDGKAKIIDCNHSAMTYTGYTKKELLVMSILDLAPPNKREEFMEGFKTMTAEKNLSDDYMLQKKDGNQIHIRVNAASLGAKMNIAFCLDIHEQKKALSDVERFNEFAIGRELKMVELKKKNKELEKQLQEMRK